MQTFRLQSELRSADQDVRSLRATRRIPAVVYGHKVPTQHLHVDASELLRVHRHAGESHIVSLNVGGKDMDVLIYDVQRNPVTDDYLHIDFLAVSATEKITVHIPLTFVGTAPAIAAGNTLETHLHSVEVKCLPKDLVDAFEVDLGALKEADDIIHVSNLVIDTKKFEVVTPAAEPVAIARSPKGATAEEAPAAAPAVEAPASAE